MGQGCCFHESCTTRSEEEKCEIEDEDIGTGTCWDQMCFALIDVYYSIECNGCLHIPIDAYVFSIELLRLYLMSITSKAKHLRIFFNGKFRPPFLPVRNPPEFQNCVGATDVIVFYIPSRELK